MSKYANRGIKWADAAILDAVEMARIVPRLTHAEIAEKLNKKFGDRTYTNESVRMVLASIRRGTIAVPLPPAESKPAAAVASPPPAPSTARLPEDVRNPGSDEDLRVLVDTLSEMTAARPQPLEALADALDMAPYRVLELVEWGRSRDIRIEVLERVDAREQGRKLHSLRDQVRDLTLARRTLERELDDRTKQLGILHALRETPAPIVAPARREPGMRRHGAPLLLLSDWHVEEPVKPESVNGLNRYDLDVADACIDRIAEAFEWFALDPRWDMREAILAILGDLFSGWIHEELVEQNFLSPVQATAWLLERLERLLLRILATTKFERILVVLKDGNHGRLTKKIRISTRTANSLEWLLYTVLAARFANEPRLQFQIDEGEYSYFNVYGLEFMAFHGDSVRYEGGVGGLLIPMRKGLDRLRKSKHFHHALFGHFHTSIDDEAMTGNGSMIGWNAYAMNKKFDFEKRRQSWMLIDSQNGICLRAPVWLPQTGVAGPGAGTA